MITIRPEPGCTATAAAGREFGLRITCRSMFDVAPLDWKLPDGSFDGLLVGSANALRHGGPLVDKLGDIPAFAVGDATAAAAFHRGLRTPVVGDGDLQALVARLAGQRLRLLRLSGEVRVPLVPPAGIEIVDVEVYRVVPRAFSSELVADLAEHPVVLLHSAAAAAHFAAECDRLAIDRGGIRLAALSPRIVQATGGGWRGVAAASSPDEPALLALAREMCHERSVG